VGREPLSAGEGLTSAAVVRVTQAEPFGGEGVDRSAELDPFRVHPYPIHHAAATSKSRPLVAAFRTFADRAAERANVRSCFGFMFLRGTSSPSDRGGWSIPT
jgi:hypothetical protein